MKQINTISGSESMLRNADVGHMLELREKLATAECERDELQRNEPTGIEAEVCRDITQRQQLGIQKYGTTVADNPLALRQWLQHAYEECLDQAVYLKRAMDELGKAKTNL